MKRIHPLLILAAVLLAPQIAAAEGSNALGLGHVLKSGQIIKVDVTAAGEKILINAGNGTYGQLGNITVVVTDPDGTPVAGSPFAIEAPANPSAPVPPGYLFPNTQPGVIDRNELTDPLVVTAAKTGTYTVVLTTIPTQDIYPWNISVVPGAQDPKQDPPFPDAPNGGGRVHSNLWLLAFNLSIMQATEGPAEVWFSMHALVPSNGKTVTWKIQIDGLYVNEHLYGLFANRLGVPGSPGFSVLGTDTPCTAEQQQAFGKCYPKVTPDLEIYLYPPTKANPGVLPTPEITNVTFSGQTSNCPYVVAGLTNTFRFTSNVDGTYWIVIDTNKDKTFDPAAGDQVLAGKAIVGLNAVTWDGKLANGENLPAGDYDAMIYLRTAEMHVPLVNVERIRPGLRIFNYENPESILGSTLQWIDTRVNLNTGWNDPISTWPAGINTGPYGNDPICFNDVPPTARCWDSSWDVQFPPPGMDTLMDTFVYLEQASAQTKVVVLAPTGDPDTDSLTTFDECKTHGTDPTLRDTDFGGIDDGTEVKTDNTDPLNPSDDKTCATGKQDGQETDVDCGGPLCQKCDDGKGCGNHSDCKSGVCDSQTESCAAPKCDDIVKNGVETDVDCGGGTCAKCVNLKQCKINADCVSDFCDSGICRDATCNDLKKNGKETDVDCGGADCAKCENDKGCLVHGDCKSSVCDPTKKTCNAPTCTDTVKNGNETDVDCGGADCDKCVIGKQCVANSDCKSNVCGDKKVCEAITCSDGKKNGKETDVDCGGPDCPKCADKKICDQGSDCVSNVCRSNVCGYCPDATTPDDCDEDGILNTIEDANNDGKVDTGETDPYQVDSDNDGLNDGDEDTNKDGKVDLGESDPRKKDEVSVSGAGPCGSRIVDSTAPVSNSWALPWLALLFFLRRRRRLL